MKSLLNFWLRPVGQCIFYLLVLPGLWFCARWTASVVGLRPIAVRQLISEIWFVEQVVLAIVAIVIFAIVLCKLLDWLRPR